MLDISCFIVFFVFGDGNPYLEQRPVTLANKNQNSLYFSNGKLPLTKNRNHGTVPTQTCKNNGGHCCLGGAHPKDHNYIILTERTAVKLEKKERNVIFQNLCGNF